MNAFQPTVTRETKAPEAPEPAPKIEIPRPPKPTFTTQKLSKEADLRGAMKQWVGSFTDEAPYGEDVTALVKYLHNVVLEERNLSKAVNVVKWIDYLIGDEADNKESFAQREWENALVLIKNGVLKAARARGLGRVSFD
ncbi:conserved hypothetical protein [Pyrenophora tritici-repentis Pt-1C-BFP]|nr:uncharacterized protein PTRG_00348 [Pyrenophora tritici-repentis Pt-1C-BFP]EDU39786.1 conserved hypothetical protein [Pyrenophora tritici-repentis Pt-1C-BFP]